jgi:hypothetical protein
VNRHSRNNNDRDYQSRASLAHSRRGHVEQVFRGRCRQLGIDGRNANAAKALAEIAEHEARHFGPDPQSRQ